MTIFSIWITDKDKLGDLQLACINSFIQHDHKFILYTYKKLNNIPNNCIVKSLLQFYPEDAVFTTDFKDIKSFAVLSDLLRIKIISITGFMYVDLDIICLSKNIPEDEYYFISESDNQNLVCNGAIRFPVNSQFSKKYMKFLFDIDHISRYDSSVSANMKINLMNTDLGYYEKIKYLYQNLKWGSTYKNILFRLIKDCNLQKYIHKKDELFICSYKNINDYLFNSKLKYHDVLTNNMWGIHMFNTQITYNNYKQKSGIYKELIYEYTK